MKNSNTINEESPFAIDELFVSFTDKKGIIQAGNNVFVRVSNYAREQLIGSPHNIIRHPDMPRCVFKLLWSWIQENRAICAYVKNRSLDGKYYWVLATVIPSPQGYLSIRIKPSTKIWEQTKDLYAAALKEEAKGGMEKGLETVLAGIKALGFADYQSFMTAALFAEIQSREQILHSNPSAMRPAFVNPTKFESVMESICQLTRFGATEFTSAYENLARLKDIGELFTAQNQRLMAACKKLECLSMNMNVSANKLGRDGLSLTVVAAAFQRSVSEVLARFGKFNELITETSTFVQNSRFDLALCKLEAEMLAFYSHESQCMNAAADKSTEHQRVERFTHEFGMISTAVRSALAIAIERQGKSIESLKQFLHVADAVRNQVLGLDLIRLGGSLEGSRTQQTLQTFRPYTQEMAQFIQSVEAPIQEISHNAGEFIQVFNLLQTHIETISLNLVELDMIGTRIPRQSGGAAHV